MLHLSELLTHIDFDISAQKPAFLHKFRKFLRIYNR